jgi:hypothetical protein
VAGALVVAIAAAGGAAWRFLPATQQQPDVAAQLAKARAEAEQAERRAKAAVADAEKAKRQLEAERAADAKAKVAEENTRAKAAPQARVAKAQPPAEKPQRVEQAPVVVARSEPEPQPQPQPKPPAQESPRNTFLPSTLWGSGPKPAQEGAPAPAQEKPSGGFLPSTLWGSAKPAQDKPAVASRYDGFWNVTRSCDAYRELAPQVTTWRMNVQDGEFVVGSGVAGQPGFNQARGKPAEDGSLVLSGNGIAVSKLNAGRQLPVFFEGRLDGERFVMKGSIGDRPCTLVIARR